MSNIIVRSAKLEDEQHVVSISERLHEVSSFRFMKFSREKVTENFRKSLAERRSISIVAERGGAVIGFAHAAIGEYFASKDGVIVSIYSLAVDLKEHRRLGGGAAAISMFNCIIRFGRTNGAVGIVLCVSSGINVSRTHKFSKKIGLSLCGGNYVGSL